MRTLDEAGKLEFRDCPGDHMHFNLEWWVHSSLLHVPTFWCLGCVANETRLTTTHAFQRNKEHRDETSSCQAMECACRFEDNIVEPYLRAPAVAVPRHS